MPPVTKGHSGQDHVTVWRWVQRYAPEMERCLRLLSAKGDTVAAKRFLAKALAGANHPHPRVINTDKDAAYPPAIVRLKAEGALEENCGHRPVQYLGQRLGTGSPGHQAPDPGKPAFSLLLGSLAHDRRL